MNHKTQLLIKRTYIVHKIDEYNFLNIELKHYIPITVEEQYVSISPLLIMFQQFCKYISNQ